MSMKKIRHLLVYTMSLTIILLGLASCQERAPVETEPTPTAAAQTHSTSGLLHHEGANPEINDNLIGTLVVRNGCVRLDVPDLEDPGALPTSYLTFWPPGFSVQYIGEEIFLVNENRRPIGRIADFVWIDGGRLESLPPELEAQRPSDCSGPYLYINNASNHIPF
jgi:hypothetical protein